MAGGLVKPLRLFATLQDGNGGLAQIYCDGAQHFVFERITDGVVTERTHLAYPRDFHDYTSPRGPSPHQHGEPAPADRRTDLRYAPAKPTTSPRSEVLLHILIAVAWPYASGPRHLGHAAGAYLPADIVARYHRLAGDDVLMVSGSDQHGTPIMVSAEKAGKDPAAFADEQHELIARSFNNLSIQWDLYTKTTTDLHRKTVQELFITLHEAGFIDEGVQESSWCPKEERSLPDRYVNGTCPFCAFADARGDQCDNCGRTLDPNELVDPVCRRCGAGAITKELRQLFLRLDTLQPKLASYLDTSGQRWRPFIESESKGWLSEGLRSRAITRDVDWGVPVPLDGWEDRRLYVWFDAVIGYLSASKEWAERRGEPDAWERWWLNDEAVHKYFIGKDNIPFHTLWWPGLLLGTGAGLHTPDEVVANHYLSLKGEQMSSSRGHGFTIDEAIERVGVEQLRHALCALNPETGDTEFSWDQAEDLTRTGLLGAIANPAHRVLHLLWKRFGGEGDAAVFDASPNRAVAAEALERIGLLFAGAHLRKALSEIHELGRAINQHLNATEPWKLDDAAGRTALTETLPLIDALAVAAAPIVPGTSAKIRQSLGRGEGELTWSLPEGMPVLRAEPKPPLEKR